MSLLGSCREPTGPGRGALRASLPGTTTLPASSATLTAAEGVAAISPGESSPAWLFNGLMPGPTLRARRGEEARIQLRNALPEPTIVHWHGLLVPEAADGHPRYAIPPGASYDYAFPIVQRAGTFWYHPHPHHRTAGQIHRGLAGFFLVTDDEEVALRLPDGRHEVLLMLQDRDGPAGEAFAYAPGDADRHGGLLREIPFGNGVRLPTLSVSGTRYRFRVLNASQARVYRLALDAGIPLTVIGNDGGLLAAPVEVDAAFLGVGERLDFLLDFTAVPPGTRMMLKSLSFDVPPVPGGASSQGVELELLELIRESGTGPAPRPLPGTLASLPPAGDPAAERTFVLRSGHGDAHRINDLTFAMDRIDERIPLGRLERWRFVNDSSLPHPVHLHGTRFRVETRTGGRDTVYPYEGGWKDTALVMPLETVSLLVAFERYRGVFPLHCHNLQHEDLGMMLNVEVV
jgi:FtsP/CotA-like multicopper oxidase with cupredoxin domain